MNWNAVPQKNADQKQALEVAKKEQEKHLAMAEKEGVSGDRRAYEKLGGEKVETVLKESDIDLIDLHYLVKLAEAGGAMPRWQDVPAAAKITGEKGMMRPPHM